MMKIYFVLGFTYKGKHYALVEEQSSNYNLHPLFSGYDRGNKIGNLDLIHFVGGKNCKKKAYDLCDQWNEMYKKNGNYLSYDLWKCNDID